jgi:hypothetical protein
VVIDVENPVISAANVNANTDAGMCTAVVNYTAPVGTDNCSGTTTTLTSGIGSGGTFPTGTSTETYTVTDASGNTASVSFDVIVTDNEAPVVTCPGNINANNDAGQCGAVVTFTPPIATDNCAGATVTLTAGLPSGSNFPVGTTVNTYSAMDVGGNTTTCQFSIIVTDVEAPVITCANNFTSCSPVITGLAPNVVDNCASGGTITFTLSGATTGTGVNDASGTFNTGVTNVQYVATDMGGNADTCSFTVTVFAAPVITASASATTVCVDDAMVTLTATPAGGTWTGPGASGTTFNPSMAGVGSTTLTYSVTDSNGCSNSFDLVLTVNSCVSVTEQTLFSGISVYPNPNNGTFTLAISENTGDLLVEVLDLSGRVVYSAMENNITAGYSKQVALDGIASGTYMLRLSNASGQRIDKISVQK